MMFRSILVVCAIALGSFILLSNYGCPTTVVGEVYMEEGVTAPYAEVKIYSANSNKLIMSESADEDGNFSIDDLEAGNYLLEVSYVGYEDYKKPLVINSKRENNTGSIELQNKFNDTEFAARPATSRPINS